MAEIKINCCTEYCEVAVAGHRQQGKVMPIYGDSTYFRMGERLEVERLMLVDKQKIIVRSIFPVNGGTTPTKKLLRMAKSELKQEK